MSSNEQPVKQRINMAHGFMKSVIRNQIDRDNYDKEIKARQQHHGRSHYRPSSSRPKKPEIQTYIPPQRYKKESGQQLFILEYEHKNGEIYPVSISKTVIPGEVAKRIGERFGLSEAFVDALAAQIQLEVDKRTV